MAENDRPGGAGPVSCRSFMRLCRVRASLDADALPPAATPASLQAQDEAPSFMGHPSTCDGEQLAGLPALCSPQQILAELKNGELVQVGDWIDVGAVFGDG